MQIWTFLYKLFVASSGFPWVLHVMYISEQIKADIMWENQNFCTLNTYEFLSCLKKFVK